MKYSIYNSRQSLRQKSDNKIIVYESLDEVMAAYHPEKGDTVVLIAADQQEALRHIERMHGLEYNAGEVIYCLDNTIAEYDEGDCAWYVFGGPEPDDRLCEVVVIGAGDLQFPRLNM